MIMRRMTGLAAVATVFVLLAVASAQAKGGSSFFGLNWSALHDHAWSGKDARMLKKSGAKTLRWSMFWARIERSPGQFDWSVQDEVIGDLASKGIRVLPILSGTPDWLANSPSDPPIKSQKQRNAWTNFLREAVQRYGPNGAYWSGPYQADHPRKRARPIKIWQVWNEPNITSHFKPHPSPARYVDLLKLSHNAIEDADPGAKVMFAGMPGYSTQINAWDFLRLAYGQKGVKHAFDIVALHPYAHNVDQMLHEVSSVRHAMHNAGDGQTPMWITEIGWGSLPKNATPYRLTKGRKGQAKVLKHAFHALKQRRRHWHIGRVLWFNFRDPSGGSAEGCSFCTSAGLLQNNFTPKPSFSAFQSFTH
jgi:polysaccharide biosynthesis protein PslG